MQRFLKSFYKSSTVTQKLTTTQMFIRKSMDKMWCIHRTDNSEQDKGANHDSYCNLDECQNHYVGWKKPDIKEYCRFSPIKNFIKKQFYSDKTHTHTHTHTEEQWLPEAQVRWRDGCKGEQRIFWTKWKCLVTWLSQFHGSILLTKLKQINTL